MENNVIMVVRLDVLDVLLILGLVVVEFLGVSRTVLRWKFVVIVG